MKNYRRCIMILADGARGDVMRDLAAQGKLPAISEFLGQPGSLRVATTAFPSTTGPAYLPFLTGYYPGTCNLPGIRWFDKDCYATKKLSKERFRSYVGIESFFMNSDIRSECKTLFEIIPRSVNIFSSVNKGVSFRGNKTKYSRIWYWYYAHLTDRWGIIDEAAEKKVLQCLKEDFEFLFVVFPGVDEFSHLASPFHPRTTEAYQKLDRSIGNMVRTLKEKGEWEDTMIWIVSDHGLSETQKHFPLNQFLENQGISTFFYPQILFKWGFEAASMVSGNGMANVYLKNGNGWRGRTTHESLQKRPDQLTDKLLEQDAVDLLASQNEDGSVTVRSRRGEARISHLGTHAGASIKYVIKGGDPFGYKDLPSTMTDRESLERTFNTDYPDAPVQLLQLFRSRRAGDVVLSASKGHDLRLRHEHPEHKSSHGSLHWEHMQIPVVTNVPLPAGPIRSVDVFPTVMKLLGRPVAQNIDGISLV